MSTKRLNFMPECGNFAASFSERQSGGAIGSAFWFYIWLFFKVVFYDATLFGHDLPIFPPLPYRAFEKAWISR